MIRRRTDRLSIYAITLTLIFVALGVLRVESLADDINEQQEQLEEQQLKIIGLTHEIVDSAIAGCQRQNLIRKTLREQLQEQIDQSHSTDYERFFPNIPPDELHDLIHQGNVDRRERIRQLERQHCKQLFPKPKEAENVEQLPNSDQGDLGDGRPPF